MSEVKHTPWELESQTQTEHLGNFCTLSHSVRYGSGILEVKQRIEDTAFGYKVGQERVNLIVASVNSHEELVEALKLIADGNQGAMVTWIRSQGETRSGLSDMFMGQLRQLIADAALAKAGRP